MKYLNIASVLNLPTPKDKDVIYFTIALYFIQSIETPSDSKERPDNYFRVYKDSMFRKQLDNVMLLDSEYERIAFEFVSDLVSANELINSRERLTYKNEDTTYPSFSNVPLLLKLKPMTVNLLLSQYEDFNDRVRIFNTLFKEFIKDDTVEPTEDVSDEDYEHPNVSDTKVLNRIKEYMYVAIIEDKDKDFVYKYNEEHIIDTVVLKNFFVRKLQHLKRTGYLWSSYYTTDISCIEDLFTVRSILGNTTCDALTTQ